MCAEFKTYIGTKCEHGLLWLKVYYHYGNIARIHISNHNLSDDIKLAEEIAFIFQVIEKFMTMGVVFAQYSILIKN